MKRIKMMLAAASFVAASTVAASAVTVIDFGAGPSQTATAGNSLTYTVGDITAMVSGHRADATGITGNDLVRAFTGSGLGVGVVKPNNGISGQLGYGEMVLLMFNKPVKIIAATFSLGSSTGDGDDATIFLNGANIGAMDLVNEHPAATLLGLVGKKLGIAALGANDAFKLRSITISAVPLPPAALLLLSGLAGIGALARRRKQK